METLTFIDVETTGLPKRDPNSVHESYQHIDIVEIAFQTVNSETLEVITSFEQKFRLNEKQKQKADPKSLEINGYNDAEWADAPEVLSDDAVQKWLLIRELLKDKTLAAQNVAFDVGCISVSLLKHSPTMSARLPWKPRLMDIQPYSYLFAEHLDLRTSKGSRTWSLHPVYDAIGGPSLPAHRAMPDVERAKYVYKTARELIKKFTR